METVTLEGDEGVLRLRAPVGGARLPLEKALGGLAEVGNTHIRIAGHPQPRVWKERLLAVLESLEAFQARLPRLPSAAGVTAAPAGGA